MKIKITILTFFTFVLTFGQTESERAKISSESNLIELAKMAKEYDSIFKFQKAEALQLAKEKGWVISKEEINGGISELIRVDKNGNPVYYTTENAGAALTTRANRLNSGGSLGLNLDGQNMNIGVWDGGKVRATHNLLVGRVTQVDNPTSNSDHATHVSGTMMGNATASPASKGMASQANLRAYDWNSDTSEVTIAAANGLLVSNHSYGAGPENVAVNDWGKYDNEAKLFDKIMYNAPYYQFVNSAGNSRNSGYNPAKDGYDLLSGKSTSKNGIIVAAVSQVTNYTGPNSVNMSSFSSWGPTDDGRIKPDICGKGVNVRSSTATSNNSYSSYSGTSMSSPNVAGTLLLLQQHYNNVKSSYMRAATLRGLALHTADEAGDAPGPDYRFGWGLLNAEKAANLITSEGVTSSIRELTLNQGDTYSFSVLPNSTSQKLEASICWTDPEGVPVSSNLEDFFQAALVNDLDIRVIKGNTTNFPWKLNPQIVEEPAFTGDNLVDNIEKIEVSNPTDYYTVTISHKGNLDDGLQKYSLILSNIGVKQILLSTKKPLLNNICEGANTTQYEFQLEINTAITIPPSFTVSGLPTGVNSTVNLLNSNNYTLNVNNLTSIAPGSYPIELSATLGSDVTKLFFTLVIQNGLAVGPNLVAPVNNSQNLTVSQTLTWQNMGANVSSYTIELAKDANFTVALQTLTSNTNQLNVNNLDFGTSYFWRVKALNICGESSFSQVNKFSTLCNNDLIVTVTDTTIDGATFTWTNPNASSVFEVLVVPTGQSPTGAFTTVNTNSYTVTGLNSNSGYTLYMRSACSENTFTALVNKPFNTRVNFCIDGIFYDSGNANSNYSNGEYTVTTMNPVNAGDKVSVTFSSFNVEAGDNLKVYDGDSINSPYIVEEYGFTGTNSPGTVTSTDATGKLTFVFYSDGAGTASGWSATVNCLNLSTQSFNSSDFVYYPNPAKNSITFEGKQTINSISIYNLLGQNIGFETVNATQKTIDISNLANGNYIFKVATENGTKSLKIVKEN